MPSFPWRPTRWMASARTWVALAILAPVMMLAISVVMMAEMRRDAWMRAEQTSQNLLQVIERDVARNVEVIDLSLRGVVANLESPEVAALSPEMRQLVLFDRVPLAHDVGVMLVLDETGEAVADASALPSRKLNNADRSYFKALRDDPSLGLVISEPVISKLTGAPVVVLARRVNKPDGAFGGVVLASLRLSYFQNLFDRVGLGREGAIVLFRDDGVRLMRHPSVDGDIGGSIAASPVFQRIVAEGRGAFVARSMRDGVERLFTFTRVGKLPLYLDVALGVDEIEANWRDRAFGFGALLLTLCALTTGLALLFGRELRRRAEAEAGLALLSRTDALTGLPNRRHFEAEFARAFDEAARAGRPLSLLVVDADHFKRINDRFGHGVGDEVLKGLAASLTASVRRPGDIVARIGGEEFAAILRETDAIGAATVAAEIHAEVARLAVAGAEVGPGAITVSIGLATATGPGARDDLYRAADAALYEAKAGGRNQTRGAPEPPRQFLARVAVGA